MKHFHLSLTIILIFLLELYIPLNQASALVQDKNFLYTISTIRTPSVTLESGTKGSASISSTSDYGSVTATAGLTFNENASASVSTLSPPSLDGSTSATVSSATSDTTGTLTTSSANDIIYVIVSINGTHTLCPQ